MKNLKNILPILILILSCDGINMKNEKDVDDTPPLVNITYPANQAIVSDTVLISSYAFDNISLEKVTLFISDSIIFEGQSGPYEYQWNTTNFIEDEYYSIRATAKDSSGNMATSQSVQVLVDNIDNVIPNGMFLYPYTGQILNGNIGIILQAEDNEGISYINLYINGDSVTTFTGPTETDGNFQYNWNTTSANEDNINTIHAKIVDLSNNYKIAGPISVTVNNLDAPDITYPQGTIISPPAGSYVEGIVNIEVNAFDNIGIHEVIFYINGISYFSDNLAPFNYPWNTQLEVEDQSYSINIDIIDLSGNTTSIYPISVTVNNIPAPDTTPPNIVIYEPASHQTLSGTIDILTIATDNDSISIVEFYQNYIVVHTDSIPPFSYNWDTELEEEDSEHTWHAIAYDISSNYTQTHPILVYVNNQDNEPPTGSIIFPYAGQVVNDTVLVQAQAEDNVGVSEVQFKINGLVDFIDYITPYELEWNTLTFEEDQEHMLTVTIFDNDSNYSDHSIMIFVNNNPIPDEDLEFPFVSILSPISGQIVSDTIIVSGFAIDNYTVDEVKYYLNAELISTFNDTPYTFQLNTLELENNIEHILTMTAEDQAGNLSPSQPVLIISQNE